jgi:hypothetical protein
MCSILRLQVSEGKKDCTLSDRKLWLFVLAECERGELLKRVRQVEQPELKSVSRGIFFFGKGPPGKNHREHSHEAEAGWHVSPSRPRNREPPRALRGCLRPAPSNLQGMPKSRVGLLAEACRCASRCLAQSVLLSTPTITPESVNIELCGESAERQSQNDARRLSAITPVRASQTLFAADGQCNGWRA